MNELIKLYEEYVELIGEELKEMAMIAYIHGYRSTRFKRGLKLREQIDKLKQQLNEEQESGRRSKR